jgi:hypothetical protein
MSVIGGRGGRPDDWDSQHARARARAAERLTEPLDADEAAWLESHLAACDECSAIAADYVAQRLELRSLLNPAPVPPRDLWARTSAAIELESKGAAHGRARRSSLRPFALLAGALVVAVAVGTLTSSRWPFGAVTATPGIASPPPIAVASPSPLAVAPTPLAVGPKDVAFLQRDQSGSYKITTRRIDEVCPSDATDCVTNTPHENTQAIGPLSSPETVFGAENKPLVVLGSGNNGSSVVAILVPTQAPAGGSSQLPSQSATPTATQEATSTPEGTPPEASGAPLSSTEPSFGPAETPSPTPLVETPSPSPAGTSSPTPSLAAAQSVEIAHGLEVLETNAGYAPDGSAFAFTAQPKDGSHGPDIYVWRVGDERAQAVTKDHRSVFGSWSGDGIVGSTLDVSSDGAEAAPRAIVIKTSKDPVALPGAGSVWRPSVDRSGTNAVYWTGGLEREGDGWKTGDGKLVIGRWGDAATAPQASALATAPAASDQPSARHETTIAQGPLRDWDARWDETGTRLAVWIADPDKPSEGKLSLYVVDPFDGKIELDNPPLKDAPALAGFSIADGRLAWATPDDGSADGNRVLILAWQNDDFGKVESAPGDFLLIR